jgi:enoyl-CoA hydratase
MTGTVLVERHEAVTVVTIDRPEVRNAVDRPTADALAEAFRSFDADPSSSVAVLTGAGGTFCAGADLKGIAEGRGNRLDADMAVDGPMGPTRMVLSKPVIAAIEGHAVAGGLELAVWCDLRVVAADATFGVYCRRWGVPLVDGGTVRLPRLIGQSRAMDLILTGRAVDAAEALEMGLANRVCQPGAAVATAIELGTQIAAFPQVCMRNDRRSAVEQWELPDGDAMANEMRLGLDSLSSEEAVEGATRFAGGAGRGGRFDGA